MEKNMEHDMDTGFMQELSGYSNVGAYCKCLPT